MNIRNVIHKRLALTLAALIFLGSWSFAAEKSDPGIEAFYQMAWQQLGRKAPTLQEIDQSRAGKELQGVFTYSYKDPITEKPTSGQFSIAYPKWIWPSDGRTGSKGTAKLSGNKILLLGEGGAGDLRGFLLRIGGEWHLMQADFPEGTVKLSLKKS